MLCFAYRWLLSQAIDSEKPLSLPVLRHVQSCGDCAAFARAIKKFDKRLPADGLALFCDHPLGLDKKIINALPRRVESEPISELNPYFRPVLVAAAVTAVLLLGVFLLDRPTPHQPLQPPAAASISDLLLFESLSGNKIPEEPLRGLSALAESTLEKEIDSLKKDAESATCHILACLQVCMITNIPTGEQTDSEP